MAQAIRHRLPLLAHKEGFSLQYDVANAGLELSRYLPEAVGGDNATVKYLLDRVCTTQPTPLYRAAYARWQATLEEMGESVAQQPYQVQTRMIVGLGAESVRETAVTLQRVHGLPYIPGSALKGLASHYARRTQAATGGDLLSQVERDVLFGEPGAAAYVTYFDAWYVPGSAQPDDRPLRRDVMTVHHPTYYRSQGAGAGSHGPWDFDDPTPLPFLSAAGQYLIAVSCVDTAWAQLALELLTHALADWGIGAKTASGYGRLKPVTQQQSAGAPARHPLIGQIEAMPANKVRPEMHGIYLQAKDITDGTARAAVAEAICARLAEVGALQAWAAKPWVMDVMSWRGT